MYVADANDPAVLEEMARRFLADINDVFVSDAEREQAEWDLDDVRGRLAELGGD